MSQKMKDLKNINTESTFEVRTGLIIWLKSKRNVKRLMNYGLLHYVSDKMDYALLYVETKNLDAIMERLEKENYVKAVEPSSLKDLPIKYDDVLSEMQKEIDQKKRKEKVETFSDHFTLDY